MRKNGLWNLAVRLQGLIKLTAVGGRGGECTAGRLTTKRAVSRRSPAHTCPPIIAKASQHYLIKKMKMKPTGCSDENVPKRRWSQPQAERYKLPKSSIKKTYLPLQTLPSITPVLNDDEDACRTRTPPILSSSSPRKTTPPKIHHTAVKIPKMTEVFMWIQGGQN